jgi:short-subunit dehydrogenase
MKPEKDYAVVTEATIGIGYELAKLLAMMPLSVCVSWHQSICKFFLRSYKE